MIAARLTAGCALALLSSAAQAAYYNIAFLQRIGADGSQLTAFDDRGDAHVAPLAAYGLRFTGIDQNPADGRIYALGTRSADDVRLCQVVSFDLAGVMQQAFRAFTCQDGAVHDLEATGAGGAHQFPVGDRLYRFDPRRGDYESYRIVEAQSGGSVPLLAIAVPSPVASQRPALGIAGGAPTRYRDSSGNTLYETVGVTLAWTEADFDEVAHVLRVQVYGGTEVPATAGALADDEAVALDYPAEGRASLFWNAAHYRNPYGYGSTTTASGHLCPQRNDGSAAFDGSTGLYEVPANNNPGFMAVCSYPSDRGLPDVLSFASLHPQSFDDADGAGDDEASGGGATHPWLLLALAALGVFKLGGRGRRSCPARFSR